VIVRDAFFVRGRGRVLSMALAGREPEPGDTVRAVGSTDAYRVLGVERNRRFGALHQGEPVGLLVERACPYAGGDDVEVLAHGT
jgi:hypothetical protein